MTGLDLITGALRLLGVVASGEFPSASELQDGLASLNDMIDTWQTERLMIFAITPQTYTLAAGQGGPQNPYTYGPSANFNGPRPVQIEEVYLNYTGSGASPPPLNLPIAILNLDQYNAIVVQNTTSTFPTACYFDDSFPARNAFFWPVPQVAYTVNIFTWQMLTAFADTVTDYAFPPGYARMLRFNLALELAPEYGLTPSEVVAAGALESKAVVKRNNIKPLFMACDPALTGAPDGKNGSWNWLTGA